MEQFREISSDRFAPTPEQLRLVEYEPRKGLLIRGEAGSGKTSVLAARAGYLLDDLFEGRLLFLVYNASLAEYVRQLLEEFGCTENIDVFTMNGWLRHFYKKSTGKDLHLVSKKEREGIIDSARRQQQTLWNDNHLVRVGDEFWYGEIEWLFGHNVTNLEEYRNKERTGRGTEIQVRNDEREFIWSVFSTYKSSLKRRNCFDEDDVHGIKAASLKKREDGKVYGPPSLKYDHVCVDEVQDFNLSWFALVVPIPRNSLTLAGDLSQRIYRRSFTWSAAGVNVGTHSYNLTGSHRTTKQIMEVAIHLTSNEDVENDIDYVQTTIPGDREGPKVFRLRRPSRGISDSDAADKAFELWESRKSTAERVVIATQTKTKGEQMAETLRVRGRPAVFADKKALVNIDKKILVTNIHQLKGLEFDHVVITDLQDESMPQYWINKDNSEKQEEAEQYLKRLVYVAMTRARKSVVLAGGIPFCRFFDNVPDNLFEDI
jgi:superfamily I DNA/RNA helicase